MLVRVRCARACACPPACARASAALSARLNARKNARAGARWARCANEQLVGAFAPHVEQDGLFAAAVINGDCRQLGRHLTSGCRD